MELTNSVYRKQHRKESHFSIKSCWTTLYDVPVEVGRRPEDLVPAVGVVNVADGYVRAPVAVGDMPREAAPRVVLPDYSPRPICRVEHLVRKIEQFSVFGKQCTSISVAKKRSNNVQHHIDSRIIK